MKLAGITISGADESNTENYNFEYNETHELPQYCYQTLPHYDTSQLDINCHEDYWGYYNGANGHSWIPQQYSLPGDGTNRNPDSFYMKTNALTSITYPTGGKTVYEMEPNRLNDGSIWGGLRVKSVSNYDSDGTTLLSYKEYEYENAYPSVPREDFGRLYSFNTDYTFFMDYEDVSYDGYAGSTRQTYVSTPAIPLSADYGSPIYYHKVTEKLGDSNGTLGKNVYRYDDSRTNDMSMCGYEDDDNFAFNTIQNYSQWANFDFGKINTILSSEERYDSNGDMVYSLNNYYEDEILDTVLLGARFQSSVNWINYSGDGPVFSYINGNRNEAMLSFVSTNYSYSNVWGVPSYKKLITSTVYKDGVQEVTHNCYDGARRTLKPITTSVSIGNETSSTSYLYPCIATDNVSLCMAERNLQVPIKTTLSRNGSIVRTDSSAYTYSNGAYMIRSHYVGIGSGIPERRIEYLYDSQNNVINICKDDVENTYIVWGYNGAYPVAIIKGLSPEVIQRRVSSYIFEELRRQNDSSAIESLIVTIRELLSSEHCQITTYLHEPLVGIIQQTSPNGMKKSYIYDGVGRLIECKDHDGYPETKYHYNYAH